MSPVPSFRACHRFVIPGDPVPKGRPRAHPGGFLYTPPATRQAENAVKVCAKAAKVRPLAGPVSLTVRFYRRTARRCDLDNLTKLVQDALNGIAYRDDSQIVRLDAAKAIDPAAPRTEVEIATHPQESGDDLDTPASGRREAK